MKKGFFDVAEYWITLIRKEKGNFLRIFYFKVRIVENSIHDALKMIMILKKIEEKKKVRWIVIVIGACCSF